MRDIIALVDYKSQFGSKVSSRFYRSGMDLDKLSQCFEKHSIKLRYMRFCEVDLKDSCWKGQPVIYTSQEDPGYHYKDYIEDVVLALELAGALVLPTHKFLRANNNKVFMEMLRDLSRTPDLQTISSRHFGTWDEFEACNADARYPLVIKTAQGATSKGVYKAETALAAEKVIKKISRLPLCREEIKDRLRPIRHKGYMLNTPYRRKFVTQNYVSGMQNDWKILVFGNKFFIEYRGVRDNDFRASGSHKFLFDDDLAGKIPPGIFAYAEQVRDLFGMPHWSIDIGYVDGRFYLIEFQALYFSSYAMEHSHTYFIKENGNYVRKNGEFTLEQLYAESTAEWLDLQHKNY